MKQRYNIGTLRIFIISILCTGVALIIISVFNGSSLLAILGLGIIFWLTIFQYIKPSKLIPLDLLSVSTIALATNIERVLTQSNLSEKGRYLPPSYLKDLESSVVFIPKNPNRPLPKIREAPEDRLNLNREEGIFLTPPGKGLSELFEKIMGTSSTKMDLGYLVQRLPKLLIEDMELVESAEIQIQDNIVTVQLTGNILCEVCSETKKLPRTYESIGCLLSSALACIFVKAVGKPMTVEKEELSLDGKTAHIEFHIQEELT
jgi:hypothetical protein